MKLVPDQPTLTLVPDESPYSPEGFAALGQRLVESEARRRTAREEFEASLAQPKYYIGLKLPGAESPIASLQIPEEAVAFAGEAAKSSPSAAAGLAAASAIAPESNRLAAFLAPIPVVGPALSNIVRFGGPLAAGGAAALGERAAQDEVLPQILPETLQESYETASRAAAGSPKSAMLGQFAGSLPYFRPGLPVGTSGPVVPLVSGGINAGIETAQQLASDQPLDPQAIALAAAGGALLNRETRLGQRIGPNLVERVSERMAGKTPEQQKAIIDQEVKLAGDTLTPEESRLALDAKQNLEAQIAQQKQAEAAAKQAAEAQKAQMQAAQSALQPPEPPKSVQILSEPSAPPSIANVATEVATQTKQSPFALQSAINKMTDIKPVSPVGEIDSPALSPTQQMLRSMGIVDDSGALKKAKPSEEFSRIRNRLDSDMEQRMAELEDMGAGADAIKKMEADQARAAKLFPDMPPEKAVAIIDSAKNPDVEFQYTVFRPGEGYPSAIQVDIINPKIEGMGANVASSNPADLRKAGADIPDVPDWVPQGQYSLEQIKQFIKEGEPKNAIREQSTNALDVRQSPEDGAGIRPADPANQAVAGASEAAGQGPQEPSLGRPPEATRAASIRRRQRGAISPNVVTPLATSGAGGVIGFTQTDQQEGESDDAFQARRLRNAAIGVGIGAGSGLALNVLARGAREAQQRTAPKSGRVDLPIASEGQDIRQTAEKVIENRSYPEQLREKLAADPSIIYDKFALNDLGDRVAAATPEQLISLRATGDQNERVAATIELANRAAVENRPEEAASLYAEASQQFTAPAQLINVAKLVRSPEAFVKAISEQLKDVKRVLAPKQEDEIRRLAATTIAAERKLAAAERAAQADFSETNETAYRNAQKEAAAAKKAVDEFVHQVAPESWGDITSKIIQGNLLTPLSLVANVYGNMVYQPVRRGASSVASALDAIWSPVTGRPRKIARINPLPSGPELEAAADGIKIAAKELLTGPGVDSYVKGEVQRGFRPLRSLAQSISGKGLAVREDGTVSLNDRAKKFIEGTLGAPPEAMFRLLSLGDKPFRRAAEAELLLEQARLRGLKGRELEKFIEFPDKATQEILNTEGRKAIFAQENKGVTKLNQFLDSGLAQLIGVDNIPGVRDAVKVFGRIVVPFRQFPVNYVMTALNFAAPELAMAKAVYAAAHGNRRKTLQNVGEGALGMMMYGAAQYLWDNGVISEPTDKDAKQRSVQYEQMGPQRVNVSALNRLMDGGSPDYQRGDLTMDWGRLGIPASVFYVFTRQQAKDRKEGAKVGEKRNAAWTVDRLGAIPGMSAFALDQSFLSGTSAFLEAMRNPDPEGAELQNWARNAFRAVTSIPVPNSVEALARAEYKYIPELKGDTLSQTFKNTWDYKTFQLPEDSRAILKRDLWGDPIPRNPEGKNPYINQFVDVTRSERKTADPFKQALVSLYQKTGAPEVYPTLPDRNISLQGTTVKLDPKDYEFLQEQVGRARRMAAEKIVQTPTFADQSALPEAKIEALQQAYEAGAKAGRAVLFSQPGFAKKYFPELIGDAPNKGESSRTVSRDLKSRLRLRLVEDRAPKLRLKED